MTKQSEFRYIIDQPAEVDFLNTHTPVASAISHSIVSEPKLKIIGLLGRWGSGKSTIVREVDEQLRNTDNKYLTFTYDAWLHQNNPLRRSFLDSLVQFLINQKKNLIEEEKWTTELKKLSGELQVTDEYETPIVTFQAKLFFLVAFCVTVGLSFWGPETFGNAWGATTTRSGVWTYNLGLGLITIPIGAWVLAVGIQKLFGKKASLFPALIFNKTLEHTNRQIFRPIEPTSIEFGRAFRELMQELKNKEVKLVVVIDNIDRIDESEALRIWASIRSFFLSSQDDNNLEFENYHPTVILPIDSKSISKMFAINSDNPNEDSSDRLARSFINKTFDVAFDVPAPVTSDWKRYLMDRTKYCLGNEYTDERYFRVRQYLESWFIKSGTQITPREINKTLNRIVALLVQRSDANISFESIAYFSINRDFIGKNLASEIAQSKHPLSLYREDWALEIAALHFGVDVKLAAQVLITDPIKNAILQNNSKLLEPFRNVEGFGDIFEQVTFNLPEDENRPAPNIEIIANAANILAEEKNTGVWFNVSWKNLVRSFNEIDESTVAETHVDRISILHDHVEVVDAEEFISTTERIVDKLISRSEISRKSLTSIGSLGDSSIEFSNKMEVRHPIFDLSGDAETYLDRQFVLRNHPNTQKRVRTDATHKALVDNIVQRMSSEEKAVTVSSLMELMTSDAAKLILRKELEDIDDFVTSAENAIRSQPPESEIFGGAVKAIAATNGFTEVRSLALNRLAEDNTLLNKLGPTLEKKDDRVIAIVLTVLIYNKMDAPRPLGNSWSIEIAKHPTVPKIINHLLDELYEDEFPIEILKNCYDEILSTRGLVSAVMNERVRRGGLGRLQSRPILSNLWKYSRMMDRSLHNKFARALSEYKQFWPNIRSVPWSDGIFETAVLLGEQDENQRNQITVELTDRVTKSTKDEWRQAILDGKEPYKSSTELIDLKELKLGVNSELASALIDTALDSARGSAKRRKRWITLSENLTGFGRRKVANKMGSVLFQLSPANKLSMLKAGGTSLLEDANYSEKPERFLAHIVIPLSKSKDGQQWLIDNAQQLKPIIDSASGKDKERLLKLVEEYRSSENENRRYWSDIIGRNWRLNG